MFVFIYLLGGLRVRSSIYLMSLHDFEQTFTLKK